MLKISMVNKCYRKNVFTHSVKYWKLINNLVKQFLLKKKDIHICVNCLKPKNLFLITERGFLVILILINKQNLMQYYQHL